MLAASCVCLRQTAGLLLASLVVYLAFVRFRHRLRFVLLLLRVVSTPTSLPDLVAPLCPLQSVCALASWLQCQLFEMI